jgi:hypothetical protein
MGQGSERRESPVLAFSVTQRHLVKNQHHALSGATLPYHQILLIASIGRSRIFLLSNDNYFFLRLRAF